MNAKKWYFWKWNVIVTLVITNLLRFNVIITRIQCWSSDGMLKVKLLWELNWVDVMYTHLNLGFLVWDEIQAAQWYWLKNLKYIKLNTETLNTADNIDTQTKNNLQMLDVWCLILFNVSCFYSFFYSFICCFHFSHL